jgi:hypothetical protein
MALFLVPGQAVAIENSAPRRPRRGGFQTALREIEGDPPGTPPRVLASDSQISASTSAAILVGLFLGLHD